MPPASIITRTLTRIGRRPVAVGIVGYVLGIVWVFLFPLVCITTGESKCRGTYMSENALLPGAGRVAFDFEQLHAALDLTKQLNHASTSLKQGEILVDWLRQLHLVDVKLDRQTGNVQAVTRPWPADDRKEALVLCAVMNTQASGLAPALAAQVFLVLSQAQWMSKNIIFITVNDQQALQTWLHRYHHAKTITNNRVWFDDSTDDIDVVDRAGVIRGALVIDVTASSLFVSNGQREIDVLTQGVNGRLPNMDLINTIVRVTPRRMRTELDRHTTRANDPIQSLASVAHQALDDITVGLDLDKQALRQRGEYISKMETLFRFMHGVAFGPTGLHAFFLEKGIDSLTLAVELGTATEDFSTSSQQQRSADEHHLLALAQVTEAVVRSLSNLSEKLHQSYYLYLLPSTYQFVSIGEYSGPLVLVLMPLLATLLSLLFPVASGQSSSDGGFETTTSRVRPNNLSLACAIYAMAFAFGVILLRLSANEDTTAFLRPVATYMVSTLGLTGGCCADMDTHVMSTNKADAVSTSAEHQRIDTHMWLSTYAFLFMSTFTMALPFAKRQLSCSNANSNHNKQTYDGNSSVEGSYWRPLKCCLMVSLVIAHGVLGMVAFPFAWLSALMCVPVYATARPRSWLTLLLLVVSSMPIQVLIFRAFIAQEEMWGVNSDIMNTNTSISAALSGGDWGMLASWLVNDSGSAVVEAVQTLMFGLRSFGSMHLTYICAVHAPAQLIGWAIWFDKP